MPRIALALILIATFASSAAAERMSVVWKNVHSRSVVVELHGQDRSMVWPGGGKVWQLDPGQSRAAPVECNKDERMCYAAWVEGDDSTAWGVGLDNNRICRDCCIVCEAGVSRIIELQP